MIYIIGGPARCGKTTLAKQARTHIDGQVVSVDGFMTALMGNIDREWLPDMFHRVREIVYSDQPTKVKITNSRKRDEIIWKFVADYLKEAEFNHDDVLLEGSVWAHEVSQLGFDHKAVFMVDSGEDHYDRLLRSKQDADHSNWMKDIEDERIALYAQFNVARSYEHIAQCEAYGYRYFDVAKDGIERAQSNALSALLEV